MDRNLLLLLLNSDKYYEILYKKIYKKNNTLF